MKNLLKKRGTIIFNKHFLLDDDGELLKIIYSNFYPLAIESKHSYNLYDDLKMTGFSEHFRELDEGDIIPTYNMVVFRDENGTIFKEMVEVKS